MQLTISKQGKHFLVEDKSLTGSPPVGRGRTMAEAVGNFVHVNQRRLDIDFVVDVSAQPAEMRRRYRELRKR